MDTSGIQSQMKDGSRLGAILSIFYFIAIVITTSMTTFLNHFFTKLCPQPGWKVRVSG